MTILDLFEWEEYRKRYHNAHILQHGAWGELKCQFGWKPVRVVVENCGAQVLFKQLPLGFSIGYIPKGPLGEQTLIFWDEIDNICKTNHAVFLRVEPDLWEEESSLFEKGLPGMWRKAASLQPRRTILVPLHGNEEDLLGRMKQKTRYNIRLAEKKEVRIQESTNTKEFQHLMEVTGKRDGFAIHSDAYYQKVFSLFTNNQNCLLLTAHFEEHLLGGLMVFFAGTRAWYFYGATNDLERNRMPAYLLQWEAMRQAIQRGCTEYDLWGIPDHDEDYLESQFEKQSDGLWGVYRFKRGFGGTVARTAGAFDRVYHSLAYSAYEILRGKRNGSD